MAKATAGGQWALVLGTSEKDDAAVKTAVSDLLESARQYGISIRVEADGIRQTGNAIFVGAPARNRQAGAYLPKNRISLKTLSTKNGFQIRTVLEKSDTLILISGGSIMGDVNGLYYLRDRLRVTRRFPVLNETRQPLFTIACNVQAKGLKSLKKDQTALLRNALAYGINWVVVENTLNLVPWGAEPEKTQNEKNRREVKKLIQRAHALHLKCFTYGDEFTYLPSFLQELHATCSPDDPNFWNAVQEKYRRLLRALPDLDGVGIRTGELTQVWGNYRAFDVMHEGPSCPWTLTRRYRTFVEKIDDVVVGEFHKLYYQRTWGTNLKEQHSDPEVFKQTFTSAIPVKNLYLVPKITIGDQGWFQPFNPTFNLTPHHTLVGFESMEVAEDVFPTFPAAYFQAGLQSILDPDGSNVRGLSYDIPPGDGWGKRNIVAYILHRLNWNLNVDVHTLARDFSAIYFGPEAADKMGEIFLLTPVAYKYGLYLEPIAARMHRQLPQFRRNIFPVMGFPTIDHGKAHLKFWRKLYLQTRPWMPEALHSLDHGLKAAEKMKRLFGEVKHFIPDARQAHEAERKILRTEALIRTNNLYIKTAFAYFKFEEDSAETNRTQLKELARQLRRSRMDFAALKGKTYHFFGVDQLLKNVRAVLVNRSRALREVAEAPTTEEVQAQITAQQKRAREVLARYRKAAVKILHWSGWVDGKDILEIQDKTVRIHHIQWAAVQDVHSQFFAPLPKSAVTVLVEDDHSRAVHPFVLEQPTAANGYTAKIYLYDSPGGQGRWELTVYTIRKSPQELSLWPTWQDK